MRRVRAEMPNKPQQKDRGTKSSPCTGLDVTTVIGETGALPTGRMIRGCVLVMFTAGFVGATGFGRIVMRAVSFFGPGSTSAVCASAWGAILDGAFPGAPKLPA